MHVQPEPNPISLTRLCRKGAVGIGALLVLSAQAASGQPPEIPLSVNGQSLTVEVAYTKAARRQGLTHRRSLAENHGMLFVFPEPLRHGMWMKDTHIPLTVAFIDGQGVIVNMAVMEPETEGVYRASRPVRYALEVNSGWFKKHGVEPGMHVEGIERAPGVNTMESTNDSAL
jgi:uncharacterized membrane protein (UPF0127 family)